LNELQKEYLLQLSKVDSLSICIIGQDKYPNGANGIAFCKDSLNDFFDLYCCGKEVLYSLGYKEEIIREKYSKPKELFFELLANGIGFINISCELLENTTERMFNTFQNYNRQFLKKSDRIVVLGSSKTKPLFESQYPEFNITETVINPSLKAKKFNSNK